MLKIWGRRTSSNVQALMWCVGELDLPYKRQDVGHRFGGTDTDAFLALNPNRTIPVVTDGDGPPIWETGSILRYLAGRYGKGSFWPAEPLARTEVDQWAEWSKINVAMAFTAPIFWRIVRTSADNQDAAVTRNAVVKLEQKLKIADDRLCEHAYLVGDNFTLADIQFGHILFRYFDIHIERANLPALKDYHQRLKQRSAYQKHVMLPYDELWVD